ncbi:MAG: hypothetical protein LBR83_00150 [Clostridiales bacterium]|jgi:hypothetical protein|nr:hypothetical protein [Clostridiales bacterium]
MACLFHKWEGCKCLKCGKIRDEQHNWNGCMCTTCDIRRDEKHDWNAYRCKKCGKTRDLSENDILNITDQNILIDIAHNYKNIKLKVMAAEKLIDQTISQKIYADIAKYSKSFFGDFGSMHMIERLTDQNLILDIAQNCIYYEAREHAAGMLTDQDALKKVAETNTAYWVRKVAAKKLIDQEYAQNIYFEIARNGHNSYTRINAGIEMLTDRVLLLKIANGGDEFLCEELVEEERFLPGITDMHGIRSSVYTEKRRQTIDLRSIAQQRLTLLFG